MSPQSQDIHHPLRFEHLINKSVLNIDSSGKSASKIANELLVGWGISERIVL
jgi:hypothetical protein